MKRCARSSLADFAGRRVPANRGAPARDPVTASGRAELRPPRRSEGRVAEGCREAASPELGKDL